jgi:hypothetical protein
VCVADANKHWPGGDAILASYCSKDGDEPVT